jgi:hypothetical protein
MSRPIPSKSLGQKVSVDDAAAEPEIAVAEAIQEYINESMAKLSEAIQERTEQLLETIAAIDGRTATGANKRKT